MLFMELLMLFAVVWVAFVERLMVVEMLLMLFLESLTVFVECLVLFVVLGKLDFKGYPMFCKV